MLPAKARVQVENCTVPAVIVSLVSGAVKFDNVLEPVMTRRSHCIAVLDSICHPISENA
jgi:hypothetical protein